jgi:membrane-associated phospholipid phosphatase
MVKTIQSNASISGAAFPSSHVAAVWIAWIYLLRFRKWLGLVTLPLVLSLSFSVVYMQYHYAVDSIAGILLVCLSYPIGRALERKYALLRT